MSRRPDGWIGWTTTGCVALLAVIAGTVSYLHMHQFVAGHGQLGWVAALTPLSVDGMIAAASTALLGAGLTPGPIGSVLGVPCPARRSTPRSIVSRVIVGCG
jgi:Protein of unknown function (DUF2637)